jgi:Uma2 family endonuclease
MTAATKLRFVGPKLLELVSADDYLAAERASEGKHEYSCGYVYAMAGARTQHNRVAVAFVSAMYAKLRGRPCEPFNSDMKVRIKTPAETRFYYPDGMIVCEPNPPGDEFQDRPVVIAEVLSVSTRRTDEVEKREAYLTIPTLSAYLLIETERPHVFVYHRAADGFTARAYDALDATIPLAAIGAELALAELYERVDFATAKREADEEADESGVPRETES